MGQGEIFGVFYPVFLSFGVFLSLSGEHQCDPKLLSPEGKSGGNFFKSAQSGRT